MTTEQLKSIFETDYNREDWRNALQEIFHIKTLYAIPSPVELGTNDFDAKAVELGNFETAEGLQVGLYEVSISPEKRLDRNKVGLRNLMRKVYQNDGDAALIVFTQGHTWRFTYASELTIVNKETGQRERKQTDPKRYTYVLGKNRHCRTAVERFAGLKSTTDLFNDSKLSIGEIEKAFSVETLTKQFYKELFDWYQWALSDNDGFAVTYPNDTSIASDDRKIDEHIIRLITRLMFVWFIKQKNLVPDQIFKIDSLKSILKKFDPYSKTKGNYYNAILQNFFFATLNKPIAERAFAEDGDYDNRRKHYGIKTYFRNPKGESWFKISNTEVINIFSKVPFLNGGLFECLDKSEDSNGKIIYHDGFSREERVKGKLTRAFIPNCLFFDPNKGLIPLLEKYNFTIEESTPVDVEVALDPELLGKVFENLLGAFNPETKETARKQSGSFYTPREIVNYMIEESLIAYLQTKCPEIADERTRSLFIPDNELFDFNENERCSLISALKSVKILDPACGSGAFPMGILNKMVDLLQKLEDIEANTPYEQKLHLIENCIYGIDIQTIAVQISKLRFFISLVSEQATNSNPEDNYGIIPLPNLETKFVAANTLIGLEKDFTDRLNLGFTEIRVLKDQLWKIRSQHFSARNASQKESLRKQDEKLRKEIQSLIVELTSKPDMAKMERLGEEIEALKKEKEMYQGENLVEIEEPSHKQGVLFDTPAKHEQLTVKIDQNKEERKRIDKIIKEKQKEIEKENSKTTHTGYEKEAIQLAKWDPYDQNTSSHFFDSEWMFDVKKGFDIVIGNPPYIKEPTNRKAFNGFRQTKYYQGKMDLWYGFACVMLDNLKKDTGILTFIATNNWVTNAGASKLRNKVVEGAQILQLIDFGNYKIFESADIQTMIMVLKSNSKGPEYQFDYRKIIDTQVELEDVVQLFNGTSNSKLKILNPSFNRAILTNKSFLFSEGGIDGILNKILNASNFQLDAKLEVATGIDVHQDFVNKDSLEELGAGYSLGEGIFNLTDDEKRNLELNDVELKLVRPFYSTAELDRFYGDKENKFWVIYTNSSFKNPKAMKPFPNLKKHLDRFQKVITSDNKPYGLHRARNEHFFIEEKIISLRKCIKPTFTYTEFDCYVSQTYFVIKTNRVNQKYLTALLNSKLIAFWLKHKGKMQGFQYQVDKGPLVELPLIKTDQEYIFATLVEYITFIKGNINTKINDYVNNEHILQSFEEVINACVYELYFAEHMKEKEIDVLNFAKELIKPISSTEMVNEKIEIINSVYSKLKEPSNEIRNRMRLFATRSENILLPIQKIY